MSKYKKLYFDFAISFNRSFVDTGVTRMAWFYRKNTEMVIRRELKYSVNDSHVDPKHVERSHVPENIDAPRILTDSMTNAMFATSRETLVYYYFKTKNWSQFLLESLPIRTLGIIHTMGLADDAEIRALQMWADGALQEIDSARNVVSKSKSAEARYIWYKEGDVENLRSFLVESTVLPFHETLLKFSENFDSISEFCSLLHDVTLLAECKPIMTDDLHDSEKISPFFEKLRFFYGRWRKG